MLCPSVSCVLKKRVKMLHVMSQEGIYCSFRWLLMTYADGIEEFYNTWIWNKVLPPITFSYISVTCNLILYIFGFVFRITIILSWTVHNIAITPFAFYLHCDYDIIGSQQSRLIVRFVQGHVSSMGAERIALQPFTEWNKKTLST